MTFLGDEIRIKATMIAVNEIIAISHWDLWENPFREGLDIYFNS